MKINGTNFGMTEELCENVKTAVSKHGITMVCDEEENVKPDIVLPANENCENTKEVVSKFGVTVLCEE